MTTAPTDSLPPAQAATGVTEKLGVGIGLMLLSSLLFSSVFATVKLVSDRIPTIEIGFFRQLFSFVPILILLSRQGGFSVLRTQRPGGHLFRGIIGNFAMMPYFLSFTWLPMADATSLSFAAPLFITALSVPLLREPVGVHRWSAVLVGFIGVLIVTHPSTARFATEAGRGTAAGLTAAFLTALMMITIRQLNRTEPPIRTVFYFAAVGLVAFGALLPFVWVRPTLLELGEMAAIGILGGLSQFVMTSAYRHAPAAILAPFVYSQIVWSTLFGYLFWDALPGWSVLIGVTIVIASGLYIVYREKRRRIELTRAEAIPV